MAELDRAGICSRIAQARIEAGLTQMEEAELLQPPVHWRTIQTWESIKDPRVPWDRLDEIAGVTGKTKGWLLHGAEHTLVQIDPERLEALVERLEQLVAALEGGQAEEPRAG